MTKQGGEHLCQLLSLAVWLEIADRLLQGGEVQADLQLKSVYEN